jgi:glycosyltransferase involved in cell wall biosynthesis
MKQFLYVGRFVHRKGLVFLCTAWEEVVKKHPDYILVLVGSGNLQPDSCEKELIELGNKNKNILVVEETDDTKHHYKDADVFIFPSEREGLSNVLLEAMSMELPIIATNIGGNIELIENKKTGLLFKTNDKESLFKAIDNIFKYLSLGKNARESIIKSYALNIVVKRYKELYDDL